MKDYANKKSLNRRSVKSRKKVYGAKKKSIQVISSRILLGLLITSLSLAAISFFYFETDDPDADLSAEASEISKACSTLRCGRPSTSRHLPEKTFFLPSFATVR